jgi:hypothetical protein
MGSSRDDLSIDRNGRLFRLDIPWTIPCLHGDHRAALCIQRFSGQGSLQDGLGMWRLPFTEGEHPQKFQ